MERSVKEGEECASCSALRRSLHHRLKIAEEKATYWEYQYKCLDLS